MKNKTPLVLVFMISYNQQDYNVQVMENVLNQNRYLPY